MLVSWYSYTYHSDTYSNFIHQENNAATAAESKERDYTVIHGRRQPVYARRPTLRCGPVSCVALGTIGELKADFVKHLRGALICSKCFLAALECHAATMPGAFLRHT